MMIFSKVFLLPAAFGAATTTATLPLRELVADISVDVQESAESLKLKEARNNDTASFKTQEDVAAFNYIYAESETSSRDPPMTAKTPIVAAPNDMSVVMVAEEADEPHTSKPAALLFEPDETHDETTVAALQSNSGDILPEFNPPSDDPHHDYRTLAAYVNEINRINLHNYALLVNYTNEANRINSGTTNNMSADSHQFNGTDYDAYVKYVEDIREIQRINSHNNALLVDYTNEISTINSGTTSVASLKSFNETIGEESTLAAFKSGPEDDADTPDADKMAEAGELVVDTEVDVEVEDAQATESGKKTNKEFDAVTTSDDKESTVASFATVDDVSTKAPFDVSSADTTSDDKESTVASFATVDDVSTKAPFDVSSADTTSDDKESTVASFATVDDVSTKAPFDVSSAVTTSDDKESTEAALKSGPRDSQAKVEESVQKDDAETPDADKMAEAAESEKKANVEKVAEAAGIAELKEVNAEETEQKTETEESEEQAGNTDESAETTENKKSGEEAQAENTENEKSEEANAEETEEKTETEESKEDNAEETEEKTETDEGSAEQVLMASTKSPASEDASAILKPSWESVFMAAFSKAFAAAASASETTTASPIFYWTRGEANTQPSAAPRTYSEPVMTSEPQTGSFLPKTGGKKTYGNSTPCP